MIVTGAGGTRPLNAVLAAIAAALGDVPRPKEDMWVVGSPPAGDWAPIARWDGTVRALVVPHGLYGAHLRRRADTCFCFAPDEARIGRGIAGTVDVPSPGQVGPTAPPALGTPLGDAWWRRLHGGRPLPETCRVAWVSDRGAAAVAAAATAWERRRAVILWSPGRVPPLLDDGAALVAGSALEVDEATSFLDESAAIGTALAREGERVLARMPSPAEVAESLVRAASLGAPAGSL